MSWISDKLFGKRQAYEEELAKNLYSALVLSGGPSSESDTHIDAISLEIPIDKLERFAKKHLIMLEAFLFVATNIATIKEESEAELSFKPAHPLAVQMGVQLREKWAERGIRTEDHYAVGERCFDEVSTAINNPMQWGRAWLDEFYENPEKLGKHCIMWTDQCFKEFQAMKMVVAQHV